MTLILLGTSCASTSAGASQEVEDEETVNVGYGELPSRSVTGAVARLDVGNAERSSFARLGDLLMGRFAGVSVRRGPGGNYQVTIRGASSLYGSNEPLYVVDGVQLVTLPGQGPPEINPVDIATIEVLKDGAAAIYGARGANGVILITTRR